MATWAGAAGAVDTVRRLQQTAGNQAVVRWLSRDGYQLETPWLLGGRRPENRYPRLMEGGLQLDPELMRPVLRQILSAENLLDHLAEAQVPTRTLSMRDPARLPGTSRPPPDPADLSRPLDPAQVFAQLRTPSAQTACRRRRTAPRAEGRPVEPHGRGRTRPAHPAPRGVARAAEVAFAVERRQVLEPADEHPAIGGR